MVIYQTTNLINNKKYIGKDRNNSPSYLGGGVLLKEDIKKFGKHNFKKEILENCDTLEDLKNKELYWLELYNVSENNSFYNLTNKSYGSKKGPTKTKKYLERGKKISKSRKGKKYKNVSIALKGLKKPKVSKALKGKKKSKQHCINISKGKKGKPSLRKGKPCLKQKGIPKPGAGPQKGICNNPKGRTTGRIILDTQTNQEYKFIKDVLEEFKIPKTKFFKNIKSNNYRFKYKNGKNKN